MDKFVLVEYLSKIESAISETFRNTQRIKLTCFDVSNTYIILGTSSGGIYVFKRSPCEFLKLIPSKEGATVCIKISADEKKLALASSGGCVIILENVFVDLNLQYIVYTEHESNTVTVMTWHGNDLYCGDNTGKVSVSALSPSLTKAIFQSPSSTLMQLDSTIIQLEVYKNYLLISTQTRTYLCDTEKERYKQIGKKLRDGYFGACFSQTDLLDDSPKHNGTRNTFQTVNEDSTFSNRINHDGKIYCARPGARLWVANFEGTVLATYQFKNSVSENSFDLITLENSQEARLKVTKLKNVSKNVNFGKVYLLGQNIILTYDIKGLYFFNMDTTSFLCQSHIFDNIKDIKILKHHIYIWRNDIQINIVSLKSLEDLLLSTLCNKQYLLCSDLCMAFNDDVLSLIEKSKRVNTIFVLENKLKEIGAEDVIEKIQNVFDKLKENEKDQKLTADLENRVVENQYPMKEVNTPKNLEHSDIDTKTEKLNSLYKQYVLNKSHKLAELTESSKILNNSNLNELPSLFESFIKYIKEKCDEDASGWCKEQMIRISSRNSFNDLLPNTIDFLNTSFLELNNFKVDCCICSFPLPKAHKRKVEHFKLACKLYDCTENKKGYLNNIPSLYKYKASHEVLNFPLIVQFSDIDIFKKHLDKITYDKWDELITLFIRLMKGNCLNCNEKIDLEGALTWNDIGKLMIESVGPKNSVRLLMRYACYIPNGQLGEQFYQSCIFSLASDQQGRAVKFIDQVRVAGTSQMFEDSLKGYLDAKYVVSPSPVNFNKLHQGVTKCSFCQLLVDNPVLTEVKNCDCGHSYHQICFTSINSICKFCIKLANS